MVFKALWKSRKLPALVIYSYLKEDSAFTAVKRDAVF